MRGKPAGVYKKVRNAWITPAGAGKTQSSDVSTLSATDHPRGCGENAIKWADGSLWCRITPADAGKTEKEKK